MITAWPSLTLLLATLLAISPTGAAAEKNDWAEGTPGLHNGATRDYYNRAAFLPWNHFMGDWWDANGNTQGTVAYATAEVVDDDSEKTIAWEVTGLVNGWLKGAIQNQGFFLRTTGKKGNIVFLSREHPNHGAHPHLVVIDAGGKTTRLGPEADTFLTHSTYRSQGDATELRVSGAPDHLLIRFDLSALDSAVPIERATLHLTTSRQYGSATIGVFRCGQGHDEPPSDPVPGLAQAFMADQEIESHPDVVFAARFESADWHQAWTHAGVMEVIDPVDESTGTGEPAMQNFQSLQGNSLRVKIAKGSTGALNTLFKFGKEIGEEPEQIYFRYYLRLGNTWNQTLQGGKLPGISGTYGIAGWGGRKSDGTDGWSARGLFKMTIPEDNPLGGTTPIGTYCYHADMEGNYGTNWVWQKGYRGYLEKNRWYCVEQFLQLNTPGKKDGIIRAWIDGRPAFEKTDIRFRHIDKLKIEQVWMNIYHGGTKPSPYDQHCFIDNVVIARKYIGPQGK